MCYSVLNCWLLKLPRGPQSAYMCDFLLICWLLKLLRISQFLKPKNWKNHLLFSVELLTYKTSQSSSKCIYAWFLVDLLITETSQDFPVSKPKNLNYHVLFNVELLTSKTSQSSSKCIYAWFLVDLLITETSQNFPVSKPQKFKEPFVILCWIVA